MKMYQDFEIYLLSLMNTSRQDVEPVDENHEDRTVDFNATWVQAWKSTRNYEVWKNHWDTKTYECSYLGHPKAGASTITELQSVVSSRMIELRKSMAPLQQNIGKAISSGQSTLSTAISSVSSTVSDPNNHQYIQSSANQMLASVSSWYSNRKRDIGSIISQSAFVNIGRAPSPEKIRTSNIGEK
ncbi:hypothetical protein BC829DRAFT_421682 [Chytridium lagenaria]|nr:hypothetical protein BC829DRAFT_421682 [Chytridium lagenaria]